MRMPCMTGVSVRPESQAPDQPGEGPSGPATVPDPSGRSGPSPSGRPSGHRGLGLALILTAAFMVVLDFSIVNVALASIERELGFSASAVQWIVTGYAITFGGLLILGGRAADIFGRRRMFMAGLLIFTAASLAGGAAPHPPPPRPSRPVQ